MKKSLIFVSLAFFTVVLVAIGAFCSASFGGEIVLDISPDSIIPCDLTDPNCVPTEAPRINVEVETWMGSASTMSFVESAQNVVPMSCYFTKNSLTPGKKIAIGAIMKMNTAEQPGDMEVLDMNAVSREDIRNALIFFGGVVELNSVPDSITGFCTLNPLNDGQKIAINAIMG